MSMRSLYTLLLLGVCFSSILATGTVEVEVSPIGEFSFDDNTSTADSEDTVTGGKIKLALEVILKEMRETEHLITQSHKKINILQRLREAIISGVQIPTTSDGGDIDAFIEMILSRSNSASKLNQYPRSSQFNSNLNSGSEIDAKENLNVPSKQEERFQEKNRRRKFDDYLILLSEIVVEKGVSALDVVSLNRKYSNRKSDGEIIPNELIIVGDRDGSLLFFSNMGEKLTSYHTGHSQEIISIKCDFSNPKDPVVITSSSDNSVYVHDLVVLWNQSVILGRSKKTSDGKMSGTKMDTENILKNGLVVRLTIRSIIESVFVGNITSIIPLQLPGKLRTTMVGTSRGNMKIFNLNGTLFDSLEFNSSDAVQLMRQLGSRVVFSSGGMSIGFLNTARKKSKIVMCQVPIHENGISDISFDLLSPSIIYASTGVGNILVFNTRVQRNDSDNIQNRGNSYGCALMYKVSAPDAVTVGSTKLVALKGYLVRSNVIENIIENNESEYLQSFNVYNTTNLSQNGLISTFYSEFHTTQLFDSMGRDTYKKGNEMNTTCLTSFMATSAVFIPRSRHIIGPSVVLASALQSNKNASGVVRIFRSILPYKPPKHDISWMRIPMILIGILLGTFLLFRLRYSSNRDRNGMKDYAKGYRVPGRVPGSGRNPSGISFQNNISK